MGRYTLFILLAVALLIVAASAPVCALKVYSNPSIQTGNVSPDGSYNEGNSMQVVSDKFNTKCANRGFSTRDSNWLSLASACSDAVSWGANAFVSEHTDASGSGWTSPHGTHGFYYQNSSGWYDPADRDLVVKCVDNCVNQFSTAGRGAYMFGGYNGDWSFFGYNLYVTSNTPNMNAILVEGLFHTNYDDTQLLKSDNGKNLYAEGLYRGVCQHYGYSFVTLDSAYNNQSYTADLKGGQQATCWVEYKNTGGETWSNSGSNPVRLGTWSPQDRSSVFYTPGDWSGANRPTAMDQASTGPGGIGRFTFIMTAPKGNYNTFTEYWKLVSEYKAWFGYEGVWFRINVTPYDLVLDNNQAGFSAGTNWQTGTMSTDKYGTDYRWRSTTGSTSDRATWTINVPTSGNYDVYAWWCVGTNRSTTAPYVINYNGGSATSNQNQQANGGKWNLLGRWNFNAGNNTIQLDANVATGYVVVADAVRMVGPY